MMINVSTRQQFGVTGADREDLRRQVQVVMEHLLELEASPGAVIHSAAVAVDLGAHDVTIEVVGVGDSFEAAEDAANSAIRTAIHVAGGHTPGWDGSNGNARYEQHDGRTQLIDA